MSPASASCAPERDRIAATVRRLVVIESRLSVDPATIAEEEPLNGALLKVNSLGFLGMLIRLEDDLGLDLPDDLFVGRSFATVRDLIDLVATAAAGSAR
ncbi:phosphopantetheine-binding protein [Streptomyces sp. NPDC001185]|uniref:phosphopantetheine-binding protein n=1 Tax=Streptomyces sp. NPDC001185 TaxID=3154380 RepID=UPI00332E0C68